MSEQVKPAPFTMVGAADADSCVDGVCEVPAASVGARAEEPVQKRVTASDSAPA